MKVRILGCSGSIAQGCRTTSFLLEEQVLVDCGTGVGDLTVAEMRRVTHAFLSHSHLDHIAALPLLLDTVGAQRKGPLHVHALPETLNALRSHVFNDVIWPDFTRIPSSETPLVQLHPLGVGDVLVVAGITLEVLPARHSVPAVGYAACGDGAWWIYSGDTEGHTPAFWQRVNALQAAMPGVGALVIETAFSSHEQTLARRSSHMSPIDLARELENLDPPARFPICITHTKPSEGSTVMREVLALEHRALELVDLRKVDVLQV